VRIVTTTAAEPVATLGLLEPADRRRPGAALRALARELVDEVGAGARAVRAHLALIAVVSAVSAGATMASPLLLHRPLVLVALCPRLVFLGLAAPQLPLPVFLLVGVLRLSLTDPAHFLVGRAVGRPALATVFGGRRVLGRLAHGSTAGRTLAALAVFARPNGMYLALAGAQRVPAWLVAPLTLTGTSAYLLAVHTGVGFLAA
jgi:hypothetical protein